MVPFHPTYEEVYRHVFVHTAIENSGWIVYEIQGRGHYLCFNAKENPTIMKMQETRNAGH